MVLTYTICTAGYGPRLPISVMLVHDINSQLWLLLSIVLVLALLIAIWRSFINNIKYREQDVTPTH